jgi:hypothetical protein
MLSQEQIVEAAKTQHSSGLAPVPKIVFESKAKATEVASILRVEAI